MLETKIPPPVYGAITAAIIWWLAQTFPALDFSNQLLRYLGITLIVLGISIDLLALGQFLVEKTTPNPLKPNNAKTMVISGLYRFSRNPMYLGLLITLAGWALYLGNAAGFICLPIFVALINRMQIIPEEHALTQKFGQSYLNYQRQVRRWL